MSLSDIKDNQEKRAKLPTNDKKNPDKSPCYDDEFYVNPKQAVGSMTATEVMRRQQEMVDRLHMEYELRKLEAQMGVNIGSYLYGVSEKPKQVPYPKDAVPYDKSRVCEACGEGGATCQFISDKHDDYDNSYIKRKCTNCGHEWKEIPLHLIPELVAKRMEAKTE